MALAARTAEAAAGAQALRPRLAMDHAERLRYFENIRKRRPFQLELLRWNHDPPEEGGQQQLEEACPEHLTFGQLECLTGSYRCTLSGEGGGGIHWLRMELAGVFLRHQEGAALLWLPEAGPNFLLQPAAGDPWLLLEVACLGKEEVAVERITNHVHGGEGTRYSKVAMHRSWNPKVRQHDASPHLTDRWLQATEDLRAIWHWDWHQVRCGSPFQFAHLKFVYTAGYPLADKFTCNCHGEERFLWKWYEDGRGRLLVCNRSWREDASLALSEHEVAYTGIGGERLSWGGAS